MESKKLVIFQANQEEYGISVEYVISIEKMEGITPIPEMPVYMKGIMKVRNELIPVFDTKQLLFNNPLEIADKSRLIVVQTSDISVGLLVDDAKEILDVKAESIHPLSLVATHNSSYLIGIVNLEQRLIAVIDPDPLVQSLEEVAIIKDELEKQTSKN